MSRLPPGHRVNFDRIARSYRWLEYLTFGSALERCRFHFVPALKHLKNALIIGEGDGRFLARLLVENQNTRADVVDSSATMLELTRQRCISLNAGSRVGYLRMDALKFVQQRSDDSSYDLVVTHFFLDCLDQGQMDAFANAVGNKVLPGATWVVSDFRIPRGVMNLPARIVVKLLYWAFRLITGLRTNMLPDHAAALKRAGFRRENVRYFLGGLLFTEYWQTGPIVTSRSHVINNRESYNVNRL